MKSQKLIDWPTKISQWIQLLAKWPQGPTDAEAQQITPERLDLKGLETRLSHVCPATCRALAPAFTLTVLS